MDDGRPSEEEIDALQDQRLELVGGEQGIAQKEQPENQLEIMSRSLFLAARVLKNTEETDAAEDKADAYKRIIKTAQVNTVIYKTALDRFLKENHNAVPDQFREVASMMSEFAPIIVQVSLHGQMGTKKLNGVFEQEIQKLVTESK